VPLRPFFLGDEEVVSNVAEEFDFHDMDFLHGDSGNLGPCFVCIGIVVEDCSISYYFIFKISRDSHLLPIINAIVINRNSLPFFPRTPGLNFFNR
jgi:hypothetical protein